MKPFIIQPDHPGSYYAMFYLLAFLSAFVWLMFEGRRRRFPMIPWMMVVASAFLFFMMGSRLIGFSKEEWSHVFRLEPIPYSTARSVLGGLLLSVPGILLAKKYLRFRYDMTDSFAMAIPLALAVQQLGCLMAGCCFGEPTDLPWAIQYGSGSHPFVQQVSQGLIPADALISLPVHPVQLYEVLTCGIAFLILIRLRKILKAPGSLFLTSLALFGAFDFLLEFARDSDPDVMGIFLLTPVQWMVLLAVLVLGALIRFKERNRPRVEEVIVRHDHIGPVLYFLTLVMTFVMASRWMDKLDIAAFNIVMLPMAAAMARHCFVWFTVPGYRLASLILPAFAFILMSQTIAEQSKPDSLRGSYNTVGFGFMTGKTRYIYGDDFTGGCNDNGKRTYYDNTYSARALTFSHTMLRGRRSTTVGLNWFDGRHEEYASSNVIAGFIPANYCCSTYGFTPYVQLDRKNVGVGIGFTAGEFTRIVKTNNGDPTSVKEYSFHPSFNVRFGDLANTFVEYKYASQFPTSFPSLYHQLSVGFGTTRKDGIWRGGGIKLGTATNAAVFVSTTTAIGENTFLDLYLGGGGGFASPYSIDRSEIGSFSLRFILGRRGQAILPAQSSGRHANALPPFPSVIWPDIRPGDKINVKLISGQEISQMTVLTIDSEKLSGTFYYGENPITMVIKKIEIVSISKKRRATWN